MDSLYRLNETGAFIWERIDGRRTIGDITSEMAEEFDVKRDIAEKDVIEFVLAVKQYLHFREA